MGRTTLRQVWLSLAENWPLVLLCIAVPIFVSNYKVPVPDDLTNGMILIAFLVPLFDAVMTLILNFKVQRSVLKRAGFLENTSPFSGIISYTLRNFVFGLIVGLCFLPFGVVLLIFFSNFTAPLDSLFAPYLYIAAIMVVMLVLVAYLTVAFGNWLTAAIDNEKRSWTFQWNRKSTGVFLDIVILYILGSLATWLITAVLSGTGTIAGDIAQTLLTSLTWIFMMACISVSITLAYLETAQSVIEQS